MHPDAQCKRSLREMNEIFTHVYLPAGLSLLETEKRLLSRICGPPAAGTAQSRQSPSLTAAVRGPFPQLLTVTSCTFSVPATGYRFVDRYSKSTRRRRAEGKVGIPPLLRDFQGRWESPALGLFHRPPFSSAFSPTDSAIEPEKRSNKSWFLHSVVIHQAVNVGICLLLRCRWQ